MSDPDALESIIAHGLLNTLSLVTMAATSISNSDRALPPATEQQFLQLLQSQVDNLEDAFSMVFVSGSSDAAAATELQDALGDFLARSATDRSEVLARLLRAADYLTTSLHEVTRALPGEVREFLSSLDRRALPSEPSTRAQL